MSHPHPLLLLPPGEWPEPSEPFDPWWLLPAILACCVPWLLALAWVAWRLL